MGEQASSRITPAAVEGLGAVEIFRDLARPELAALERVARKMVVRRGRSIYRQGDAAQGLCFLLRGRVRLSQHSQSGKRLELAVLEAGTFFGELPLFGFRVRHASAEALDDCYLYLVDQADMERQILATPRVALRIIETMYRRLMSADDRLQDLAYRSVPTRLAALLLRLATVPDDTIEGLSHQELADKVGAYRETVTRILNEFQGAGYIELGHRYIRILDLARLSAQLDR